MNRKKGGRGPGKERGSGRAPGRRFPPRRHGERPGPPPPRPPDARSLAVEALSRLDRQRSLLVPDVCADIDVERRLDRRGRRFFLELVYGVLRRRSTLDCVIAAYSRERISDIDANVLQVLRIGLYQLLYLEGVPPFAAISESVRLVERRHAGVKSFVNALLRSVQRETKKVDLTLDRGGASPCKRLETPGGKVVFFRRAVFIHPDENRALHLAQVHSLPPFLVERWLARYDGAVVESLLLASHRKPPVTARVQRLRIDREGLLGRLRAEGIPAAPGSLPESIQIAASPLDAVRSAAFAEGLFYLQDEAAMKAARALDPRPGERILDLCAAPGGKATHLAELSGGRAHVVAADRDEARLARLRENVARLGLDDVEVVRFDALVDGPLPEPLRGRFDAVLVDAPCSNTGVLCRRPEVRWRVSPEAVRTLAERGRRLLHAAARLVRPGGRLLHSTCSLEPEENEEVVRRVLVANPGLERVESQETLPSPNGPDGGFFALLRVTDPGT